MKKQSVRLISCILLAEIFSMAGFSTFAAILVEFSRLWGLSSTDAGWISSAYFMGYVLAVPVLVGMTDRIDARKIYMAGCVLGVISGTGFACQAMGMKSAMFFRALAGASLAGTYMPGLRILTERLSQKSRLRVVPYYTASFGIGVSLSFLLTGWIVQSFDWHIAFLISGFCSVAAIVLIWIGTLGIARISQEDPCPAPKRHPLDLRPVFANREALAYILAYSGHCWELLALRSWLPAFLLFAWTRSQAGQPGNTVTQWSTLIVLIGVPASIIGAEVATQHGRKQLIQKIAIASVVSGIFAGLSGTLPFWVAVLALFAYNFAVTADSGALTTGALAAARPGEQGATLAVHSILGFIGGIIGPLAVGLGLDMGGGITRIQAWYLGFLFMAAGSAIAACAISLVPDHVRNDRNSPF
jgi:MFS family permease